VLGLLLFIRGDSARFLLGNNGDNPVLVGEKKSFFFGDTSARNFVGLRVAN
jgi:hypothetical protein